MEKFEMIMEAFKARLEGVDPSVPVIRNADIPEKVEAGNAIFLNDGAEQDSERPLGGFGDTSHTHTVEILLIVAPENPDDRDTEFADLLRKVRDALLLDTSFGGLVDGFEMSRPDSVTDAKNGSVGYKAATLEPQIIYQTESFI